MRIAAKILNRLVFMLSYRGLPERSAIYEFGELDQRRGNSLLRRGSKGFFSGGEDPLSNVSAGTESYQQRRKAREPLPDTTPKMAAIWGRQFSVGYS